MNTHYELIIIGRLHSRSHHQRQAQANTFTSSSSRHDSLDCADAFDLENVGVRRPTK
jgi:hypothetical protein